MSRIVFVGAGPGRADLITLRGAQALREAEVVLVDALTDPALHEFAPDALWVDVGKRGYRDSTGQAAIIALLLEHAERAANVVRLKGGDPSLFGRLEEELAAVQAAGHEIEVVPGVTAALAAAAATQRPLTRRGSGRSVSLATAMTRTGEMLARRTADTEVYYMAGHKLGELGERLRSAGWPADTPVLVVSRAGWPDARSESRTVADLEHASEAHAGRPTVVAVGAGAAAVAPARHTPSD